MKQTSYCDIGACNGTVVTRYFLHAHDFLLLNLLYALESFLRIRSLILERPSTYSSVISLCRTHSQVMEYLYINALFCIYSMDYYYSLGDDRFNNFEGCIISIDTLFVLPVSIYDCYTYALQLCFEILNPDDAMRIILEFFTEEIDLSLDADNSELPKGKTLLISYIYYNLLSAVYDRCLLNYDADNKLQIGIINILASPYRKTLTSIITDLRSINDYSDKIFLTLKDIAIRDFDIDQKEEAYELKEECLNSISAFVLRESFMFMNSTTQVHI